jgi:hypothetical protein
MTKEFRLKKAIEYLKEKGKTLTNEAIAFKLGYRTKNYVSDILSGSKDITEIFLEKLEGEYSISKTWIETGIGLMINEETIANEPNANDDTNATSNSQIEVNTSAGKKFFNVPANKNEIELLNAVLAEKEKRQKESEQRAEKAEQEKNMLYSVIRQNLSVIQQNLTTLLIVTNRIDQKLGEPESGSGAQS